MLYFKRSTISWAGKSLGFEWRSCLLPLTLLLVSGNSSWTILHEKLVRRNPNSYCPALRYIFICLYLVVTQIAFFFKEKMPTILSITSLFWSLVKTMERHGIVILDCYGTQANSQKTIYDNFVYLHP